MQIGCHKETCKNFCLPLEPHTYLPSHNVHYMQTHCPWFYHFRSIYQLFKNGVCSWCLTIVYFHVSITFSVYMKIKSLLQSKMHTPFLKGILRLLV